MRTLWAIHLNLEWTNGLGVALMLPSSPCLPRGCPVDWETRCGGERYCFIGRASSLRRRRPVIPEGSAERPRASKGDAAHPDTELQGPLHTLCSGSYASVATERIKGYRNKSRPNPPRFITTESSKVIEDHYPKIKCISTSKEQFKNGN